MQLNSPKSVYKITSRKHIEETSKICFITHSNEAHQDTERYLSPPQADFPAHYQKFSAQSKQSS